MECYSIRACRSVWGDCEDIGRGEGWRGGGGGSEVIIRQSA